MFREEIFNKSFFENNKLIIINRVSDKKLSLINRIVDKERRSKNCIKSRNT